MSAWILPKEQLNVIVSYFVNRTLDDSLWCQVNKQWQYATSTNAEDIAQILYAQNVKSVNTRYNDSQETKYQDFEYLPQAKELYTPAEIAMAIDSYEYQACETDDFYSTEAYRIVSSMRKHLLGSLWREEEADTWRIDEVRKKEVKYI